MANSQQRKLEKKRQKREDNKRRDRVRLARGGGPLGRAIASAAKAPFGPCAINEDWADEGAPALVMLTVTRVLGNGLLLPASALIDRTCLGAKDGMTRDPVSPSELSAEFDLLYTAHGGWLRCEPVLAQSVLFHALDYASRLGFKPHRDVALELFGPRPAVLLDTAWRAAPRPLYVPGPHDDTAGILRRLVERVGADGFDLADPYGEQDWDADERDDEESEAEGDRARLTEGDAVAELEHVGVETVPAMTQVSVRRD